MVGNRWRCHSLHSSARLRFAQGIQQDGSCAAARFLSSKVPGFWPGSSGLPCHFRRKAPWKDYVKHPWKPIKHLYNLYIQLLYGAIVHGNVFELLVNYKSFIFEDCPKWDEGMKKRNRIEAANMAKPDRRFVSCDLRSLVWRNALQVWRSLSCGKCRFLNADVESQLI